MKNMKIMGIMLMASLVVCVSLAACGSTGASDDATGNASEAGSADASVLYEGDSVEADIDVAGSVSMEGENTLAESDTDGEVDEYSEEEYADETSDMDAATVGTKTKINTSLKKLLNTINNNVRTGTAGSSLVAEEYAESLIKWGKKTKSSNKVVKNTVSAFLSTLSSSEKSEFIEKLSLVDEYYMEIMEESKYLTKVETVIESAGVR